MSQRLHIAMAVLAAVGTVSCGGLENAPRLFAVEDLTVRTAADGENREDLEGSVRLVVFAERGVPAGFAEESDSAAGG